MFGHPWRKKDMPLAERAAVVDGNGHCYSEGLWVGSTSARRAPALKDRYLLRSKQDPKLRAKTFPGIARAMAEQWGGICPQEGEESHETQLEEK